MIKWTRVCFLVSCLLITSCYSFKGITISPDIETFIVLDFVNKDATAPANIEIVFSETLREKIRTESRLKQDLIDPDIQFEGSITKYETAGEAPVEGSTVDLIKLTISVQVIYMNNRDEEDTWSKTFSNFRTYGADQNLLDVEDDLIDEIFEQITESVFNDAFTDW